MDSIEIICLVILGLLITKDIILIYFFIYQFKTVQGTVSTQLISIVVAARNEEENIEQCINSLLEQDYGQEKIEILVGNDASKDKTLEIIKSIAEKNPVVRVFDITELVTKSPGKMNVLAQLCEKTNGKFLLFTDADTTMPRTWVSSMVSVLAQGYGIVTGVTLLKAATIFDHFQNIDWAIAIASVKTVEDAGIRVTSIGNNMGVSTVAYKKVGGFRGIPYSITEDFELYKSIINAGFKCFHLYGTEVLAMSSPTKNLKDLIFQRERWFHGVVQLPFVMVFILVLNSLFVPVLFILILLNPFLGLGLGIIRILLEGWFLNSIISRLKRRTSLLWLIPFELYQGFINLAALIRFLIPGKVRWKGRSL